MYTKFSQKLLQKHTERWQGHLDQKVLPLHYKMYECYIYGYIIGIIALILFIMCLATGLHLIGDVLLVIGLVVALYFLAFRALQFQKSTANGLIEQYGLAISWTKIPRFTSTAQFDRWLAKIQPKQNS